MTDQDKRLSRRHFVGATGAATLAGLAGCSGGGGGGGESGGTLEVLHAWTGGDGATAAEALVEAFEEEYPDIEHEFNPIGGGGNQNLDAVVANRLQNNEPPSAFAGWPGPNLQQYEGVLGDVGNVWDEESFEDVMVQEAVDLHQRNDAYRAVPLGSHRLNCMFYNTSVVEEAGVDPDSLTSVSALIDALETVQNETDAIPMTHGASGTWTTTQLFSSTMLGQEGYEAYMNFLDGSPDEEAVRATFESLAEILGNYINDDASSIGLTESNQNIIEGNAAFIHQGNWAAGAYRNAEEFSYDEDWGFKTYPGSEDMYMLHFDSFLYPSDNPTSDVTDQFMTFVGSEAAQVAFNQYKGSIPTRTDVDMSEFGPFLQETQEDFADAEERPPNLQHGLGVPSETMTALNDVVSSEFSGPYNVDAATEGFVDAVSN